MEVTVRRYRTVGGLEPFTEWLSQLGDRKAQARILVRIDRMSLGNYGDAKVLREGVWELRVDYGPGYRVYFAREGKVVVILLCAGDKRTQDADIERAIELWQDYNSRRSQKPGAKH